MSTVDITRFPPSGDSGAGEPPGRYRRIAVVYEQRHEGGAALRYACSLAARNGVPLTVLSVARRERTDIGCGACREGAMFRNELACEFATTELAEARSLVESEPAGVAVDYALARGWFTQAVLSAAADHGADVIVLPERRRGRLRRAFSRDRVAMLRRRTGAWVIVAPGVADS